MSQFIDFTLPSTVPGRTLHGFRCVPEGQVRAVLQLSHGMVEYIDRYRPLAEYLADRGILVTGHDHLGHGASIRTKEDYGYFAEPDGNRAVLADLHAVTVLTKELYPNLPYFLLGHSMGSFYARQYLCEYGRELNGAIIMGTGFQPKALVKVAKTLCRVLDGRGLEYRLAGEGEADVYEAHDLSQLILDLHQAGCQVTGLHQRDETLESYYMNLVGGGRDV
mgnify:CR=1 FL=1